MRAKAEVKLDDLNQLCFKMNEAQNVSERLCLRLGDLQTRLGKLDPEATTRFKHLIMQTHGLMLKYVDKHIVTRLVGSQVVLNMTRDLNRQMDTFLTDFKITVETVGVHNWKKKMKKEAAAMKAQLRSLLDNKETLAKELRDPQIQKEAMTLLMFECDGDKSGSEYSSKEMKLITDLFCYVSSLSQLNTECVPEWFVPPHKVKTSTWLGAGSFASVHRGTWNDSAVAVKSVDSTDEKNRELFLDEVEIWIKLKHPHIVTLFRACHVGNPFFVCDLASNGTLLDYLSKDKTRSEVWIKLHEAALGLQYLHTEHKVVHGDLKCNNILIGADKKAKLADFGLSFVLGDSRKEIPPVGAINWKAPEILNGNTLATLASDVYSFGMCIVEAVTGRVPWNTMPDVTVKLKILNHKSLPKQPTEMNESQWNLVKRMCTWEPTERITISKAVDILQELDFDDAKSRYAVHKAEIQGMQPRPEPEPLPLA